MSDRPKLPRHIVVLNIIMIVIILVICALVFALTWSAKDLGWTVPTASDSSSASSQIDESSSVSEEDSLPDSVSAQAE